MLFKYIEKLRAKPEKQKKQIAFISAFFLAGLIFVVWLSVLYPDFRQSQARQAKVESLEPSPLSTFTNELSSGISAIQNKFSEIKTSIASFSTAPAYYNSATGTETIKGQ